MNLLPILKVFSKKRDKGKDSAESKFFKNLSDVADNYFPYEDPSVLCDDFNIYRSIDLITFKTSNLNSKQDIIGATGLKTVRDRRIGYGSVYWEASYSEYESVFHSRIANRQRSIASVLSSIYETIREKKSEYNPFIERYSGTIENINTIINKYGVHFIMDNTELEGKLGKLVASFVKEYKGYTESIEVHKRKEVLKLIEMEQTYVDISIDTPLYSIEYNSDFSQTSNK